MNTGVGKMQFGIGDWIYYRVEYIGMSKNCSGVIHGKQRQNQNYRLEEED